MEYRPFADELAAETRCVQELHRLLAAELDLVSGRSTAALSARTGGELSARWERDVAVHRWSERAAQLRAARSGLCFGRLDGRDGPPLYVGRVGLTAPDGATDDATALLDWRAPAARPFYCATLASPMGVVRRRHFQLAGIAPDERVVDIHDDIFTASLDDTDNAHTAADPALLAALSAPRGSAMRDIVSTIQAEQDAVIRLPLGGVVVIEGGPGTGKTAVALHRVAYLLYTHREQLARRGVLVVGPSGPFLEYVGGVLPSLGESAVVFTTPGRLHRGVDATAVGRTRGRPAEGRPGHVRGAAQGGGGRADPARRADPDRARRRHAGGRPEGGDAGPAGRPRQRAPAQRGAHGVRRGPPRAAGRARRRADHRRGARRPRGPRP